MYWVPSLGLATVLVDEKGRIHTVAALVGLESGSRSDVQSHRDLLDLSKRTLRVGLFEGLEERELSRLPV